MKNLLKHRFNSAAKDKDIFLFKNILKNNMFYMEHRDIEKANQYIKDLRAYYGSKSELLEYAIDILPIDNVR